MKPIAIVAVGYDRPKALERLLGSLGKAYYEEHDIPLIISIDHSGNEEVVRLAENFCWEYGKKTVICRKERLGLRKHILACGDLSIEYGAVILLEDDLYVSPYFYSYACKALEAYGDEPKISGISLYTERVVPNSSQPFLPFIDGYDVYFHQWAQSWGQAWNARMWRDFRAWYNGQEGMPPNLDLPQSIYDWPETSWAKYFQAYIVSMDKYFVYSRESLTTNFGDAGVHYRAATTANQSALVGGNREWNFPAFGDTRFVYDIYFEPKGLGKYLDIPEDELQCSLYGTRKETGKRYILSGKPLPYRQVASYALAIKPVEWNIVHGIKGDDIFLYDTEGSAQGKLGAVGLAREKWLEYAYGAVSRRDLVFLLCRRIPAWFRSKWKGWKK